MNLANYTLQSVTNQSKILKGKLKCQGVMAARYWAKIARVSRVLYEIQINENET